MKPSKYHPEWQINRINFIIDLYGKDFFRNKRILELAPCNGFIGNYFQELQSEVKCIEGRHENLLSIKDNYPNLNVIQFDLDTPDWTFGSWDIIINFGLLYHLQNYHEQHLINCIKNCKLLFLESVIFDSHDAEIFYRNEHGFDQSLTGLGGTPSTKWIEDVLQKCNCNYTKYSSSSLNGGPHYYDWIDKNSKILDCHARRFWIITND